MLSLSIIKGLCVISMAKKERTINEVYALLTDFFKFTKGQFEKVEGRLEKHDKLFGLMGQQLGHVAEDVRELKDTTEKIHSRLQNVEQDVLIIREDVETLGKIVGRDSTTLKSHGRRITTLERSRFL